MDDDDPRTPLLGVRVSRTRNVFHKLCSGEAWKRRLPIATWLPTYRVEYLVRDLIAGLTVALTSVPQGIAYALIAGLPPQIGLYSSIFPGFVYAIFGSCKDVTVGPTAILSALIAKYVVLSADFAFLISFLSGCIILLFGILHLGFLLDLISKPVINGFTTAAALQISASQLKSLFRVSDKSGGSFLAALIGLFKNISTIHLWDSVLGVGTIITLFLLKRVPLPSLSAGWVSHVCRCLLRARNALVVFGAATLAYCLFVYQITPFALIGKIDGGFPHFSLPPFSTTIGNRTVPFEEMLSILGPESLVIPLVAVLESIAIAKAFAGSKAVDCSQEMFSLGLCNALSSFGSSMPSTGSFTRSALNHSCDVASQAGAFFKASFVLIAVSLLSQALFFIPRATLAAVIIVAMCSIIDLTIIPVLWRNSKSELAVYLVCVLCGIFWSLEWALLVSLVCDILRTTHRAYTAHCYLDIHVVSNTECLVISYVGSAQYASATRVHAALSRVQQAALVIDGRHLLHIDVGVAESITSAMSEHAANGRRFVFWNFKLEHEMLLKDVSKDDISERFITGTNYTTEQIIEYINAIAVL